MTQTNTVCNSIQDAAHKHLVKSIDGGGINTHVSEYMFNRLIIAPVSEETKDRLRKLFHKLGAERFTASLALRFVNQRMDKRSINAVIKLSLANTKGCPLLKVPPLKPALSVPLLLPKAV